MKGRATVLFTCCGGTGGWSILRSLEAIERYRLIGVDSDPLSATLYMDGLDAAYVVPGGDQPNYVDRLLEIVEKEDVSVVWPCSDEEVIALADEHARFATLGARIVTAGPEVISRASDKLAMVHTATEAGIPVPISRRMDEALDDLPPSVIVRPRTGRSGHGVCFFDSVEALKRYQDALGDEASRHFVQECLPYRRGTLYMAQGIFDEAQNRLARFASRSIKTTYDWGGPAQGGVPVDDSRLHELGDRMFEASGPWFGPVNAEFIYVEERDEFVFIEVNPRYWGYSYLATAAGVNFPDLTVRLALGEDVEPVLDYRLDIVTITSREHLAFPKSRLLSQLPDPMQR